VAQHDVKVDGAKVRRLAGGDGGARDQRARQVLAARLAVSPPESDGDPNGI
jgi:hypothetical protein